MKTREEKKFGEIAHITDNLTKKLRRQHHTHPIKVAYGGEMIDEMAIADNHCLASLHPILLGVDGVRGFTARTQGHEDKRHLTRIMGEGGLAWTLDKEEVVVKIAGTGPLLEPFEAGEGSLIVHHIVHSLT